MTTTRDSRSRRMLRDASLYCTKARVAVLSVLMDASGPLRQDEISERIVAGAFDKVTIYRTLDSLVDAGLVHRAFCTNGRGISSWPTIAPSDSVIRTSRALIAAGPTASRTPRCPW
jgi:Fe2+ or Zn2+ uptake regulation protein